MPADVTKWQGVKKMGAMRDRIMSEGKLGYKKVGKSRLSLYI